MSAVKTVTLKTYPSFYNLPTKTLSRGFWTEIYALLVSQTMQTVMFTRKKGISIILVWLFVLCTYNILPKERLEILRERICKLSSTQTLLNSTSNMKNIAKDFHHQKSDRYTPKQNPNTTTILIKIWAKIELRPFLNKIWLSCFLYWHMIYLGTLDRE